jgi:tRNA-specific 2-thiouridylase
MTLFPVGDSPKEVVRAEAAAAGLLTAEKKDSQGICFLGHIDIKEFISHYAELISGDVLSESGEVIGSHDGALIYTLGQRHGFTLNTTTSQERGHYVIARNIERNTITVGAQASKRVLGDTISLETANITRELIPGETLSFQTRYRQKPQTARVTSVTATHIVITPTVVGDTAAPGQSCVLYDGTRCIGGGIIA